MFQLIQLSRFYSSGTLYNQVYRQGILDGFREKCICLVVGLLLMGSIRAQSISSQLVSNAGQYFAGATGSVSFSLGEPVITSIYGTGIIVNQGFQQAEKLNTCEITGFNPLADTIRICGTSTTLDAGSGYTSYLWSTGATTQTISPTVGGKYKVTVTNAAGCKANDSTFLGLLDVKITQKDTTVCRLSTLSLNTRVNGNSTDTEKLLIDEFTLTFGGPFTKTINTEIGATYSMTVSGVWALHCDFIGQLDAAYAFNQGKAKANFSFMVWNGASIRPSPDDYNSSHIYEYTDLIATQLVQSMPFSDNPYGDNCGSLSFKVYKQLRKLTYLWSTGATTPSITVNPTQTTKYYVTVSDGITSCRDSVTVTVADVDKTITALTPTQICATGGGTVTLQAANASTYKWLRNGTPITGATARQFNAIQTGDYRVVVTNALGCTDTSSSIAVTLYPLPTGTLQTPTTDLLCTGGSVKLTATGGATYRWLLNGTEIAITSDPDFLATQPGTYTVNLVSAEGCIAAATGSVTLRLVQRPTANFNYNRYCAGLPIQFTDLSNTSGSPGGVSYRWSFGSGQGTSTLQNPSYTYANSGSYLVSMVLTPNGCPTLAATSEKILPIERPVPGITYPPVNAIVNKPFDLAARSQGVLYQWIPGSYLSNPLLRTPIFTSSLEQQYRIQITTAGGCVMVDTQLVRVFAERDIFVPQGFTPNNDGQNDRLYPILVGILDVRVFRVYNRWGNLVYDNRNANALTGWDGMYKGTPSPMDTYAWVAEGVDIDGKTVTRTGNIILIR